MESIGFPLAVLALAIFITVYIRRSGPPAVVETAGMRSGGRQRLTWFCDTEDNARYWFDFGARKSKEVNRGYLQVSLDALQATQSRDFAIQTLIGRDAIVAFIGETMGETVGETMGKTMGKTMGETIPGETIANAAQLPPALFRLWAVANLCAKRGGLVMDGASTLCVGPAFADSLGGVEAATFGVDPDEPVANPTRAETPAPAPYVGYAQSAGHPGWVHTASVLNAVVAAGPTSWSAALARRIASELYPQQLARGLTCIREVDGGRLPNGQARQLEDLLGRVGTPPDPNTALTPGTVYVPFDGDALVRRFEFAWFPRMSAEQIKESDLVWASYAGL
jgi:hypothetical protein